MLALARGSCNRGAAIAREPIEFLRCSVQPKHSLNTRLWETSKQASRTRPQPIICQTKAIVALHVYLTSNKARFALRWHLSASVSLVVVSLLARSHTHTRTVMWASRVLRMARPAASGSSTPAGGAAAATGASTSSAADAVADKVHAHAYTHTRLHRWRMPCCCC